MFKRVLSLALICFAGSLAVGYAQLPSDLSTDIIPKPVTLDVHSDYFTMTTATVLECDKKFKADAAYIVALLKESTSVEILSKGSAKDNKIVVAYDATIAPEAYTLSIDAAQVKIVASDRGGVVNAMSSLQQLIMINNDRYGSRAIYIPSVTIDDKPLFGWRGLMVDVSRHFYTLEQIYDVVDKMAFMKLNRLHLHLSDDQGYRVEMKKYPKLNEIGSWRVDYNCTDETKNASWGKPVQQEGDFTKYGGFYTQEELKALVKYAQQRNIEILPEIDVPGHSQAIIASYPEATCFPDRKYYVATGAVMGHNTICPTQEFTYELMEGIIEEIADIFPFEYIHIGGDECNKALWEAHDQCQEFISANDLDGEDGLQSYFIHRLADMVEAKGRKVIGWDEILEGGLVPTATVMSWRGEKGGIETARMGQDVIMSPSTYNYFDLKQGQSYFEPNIGYSQVLLSKCYNSTVIPSELTPEEAKHILGNQANIWSESLSDYSKFTYMLYPRLFAVAENSWTPECIQDWDDFVGRLKSVLTVFDSGKVRYAKSVFTPWMHHKAVGNKIQVTFTSELTAPEIRYTTDGTTPTMLSPIYSSPIIFDETTVINAAIFENGKILGNNIERKFTIHKGYGAMVKIGDEGEYVANHKLVDLNYGEFLQGGDNAWTLFKADTDIYVKLKEATDIESVMLTSEKLTHQANYSPARVQIYATVDGVESLIVDQDLPENVEEQGRNLIYNEFECKVEGATDLRVTVYTVNPIPATHSKKGQSASLRLNEIVIL